MRRFWMVMRYKDESLQQHPNYGERNVFYMGDVGRRGDITHALFPSEDMAHQYAREMSQQNPTESILILEQKAVYELPVLPASVRKTFTAAGELITDD